MAKLNSEFNYRYQVIGETVWEKIKTLHGFLDGRKRAAALEKVQELKMRSLYEKLKYLQTTDAPLHETLELQATIVEVESSIDEVKRNFEHNRDELNILEKLLGEFYALAEPTRLHHSDGTPYSDEEMFEVNAVNEFTVMIAREMQAEIISTGRPSAAKIKNAMSNPITWAALKQIGFIPQDAPYIAAGIDPTIVQLLQTDSPVVGLGSADLLEITKSLGIANETIGLQPKKVVFDTLSTEASNGG
jgi:hypothetical protein